MDFNEFSRPSTIQNENEKCPLQHTAHILGVVVPQDAKLPDVMENSGLTTLRAQQTASEQIPSDALAKLDDLRASLLQSANLKEGLKQVLAAAIELLGADKGNIQLFDPEQGVLAIEVQQGFVQAFLDSFKKISTVDETACGRALRLRRLIVIEDTETDSAYARYRAAARVANYRAVVSTPIMGSDVLVLGMISVHFSLPHQPSDQDKRVLKLCVHQAADLILKGRR